MTSFILIGAFAGLVAGSILASFSSLVPHLRPRNAVKQGSEVHLLGLLIRLLLAMVFGAVYGLILELGWVGSFGILPLLLWSSVLAFTTAALVMLLEGDRLFGRKHDVWFFVDLVIVNGLWALLVAGFAALWFAS